MPERDTVTLTAADFTGDGPVKRYAGSLDRLISGTVAHGQLMETVPTTSEEN